MEPEIVRIDHNAVFRINAARNGYADADDFLRSDTCLRNDRPIQCRTGVDHGVVSASARKANGSLCDQIVVFIQNACRNVRSADIISEAHHASTAFSTACAS